MEKREWLEKEVGAGMLTGLDDLAIDFYYMAMHDNGMDLSDADRYAWLNMLFGENIGIEAARGIINWYWEHDLDVMDITTGDKEKVEKVCDELGLNLFFYDWLLEEPDYMDYRYMAVDRVKPLIDKMFASGHSIDEVCGCICGLYHDYLINEPQEVELYEYADPDNVMDDAPYEAWGEWEGENPLDYTKE